jgi:pyruvate dehydrogenase E2 component (dihydrolipoamide acetyltransferase)
MAISVVMPALEMAQETGKLVAWLKKEGESVRKGEPLLEIETDKAVMEVEALADGTLAGITGKEGTDIPVGQTIAWIVAAGEVVPSVAGSVTAAVTDKPAATAMAPAAAQPPPAATSGEISPKARRMAKDAGIDISTVSGSGPGGEVLASDIQAAIDAKPLRAAPKMNGESGVSEPLSSIGRLMAERTTQSWTTVPHFFVQRDIDATGLNKARAALGPSVEQSHGVKLTHTDLLIALVARALRNHPRINATWIDNGIRLNQAVNIAIAMAVDDGVVAAVISNAHTSRLGDIAKQRQELMDRARSGRLRPADLSGGTFTISNLGMFQVDSFSAIIAPPQAAILAVGAIHDRVVPVEGKIEVRPTLSLTLSSDHRVIDGAKAAVFMQELCNSFRDAGNLLG